MERLARRVGLGLAARGEVDEVVAWSWEARRAGLDSVWIHDSYFERDAVSYVSAIASELGADERDDGFRIALGAVNPNTRHPVVLAMTGSALDEMAPGRIVMGLGHGLPLRLKQMGIPYAPRRRRVARVSRRHGRRSGRCGPASACPRHARACRPSSPCSRRRTGSPW